MKSDVQKKFLFFRECTLKYPKNSLQLYLKVKNPLKKCKVYSDVKGLLYNFFKSSPLLSLCHTLGFQKIVLSLGKPKITTYQKIKPIIE